MHLASSKQGPVAEFCEQSNETSGCIKVGHFLRAERLSASQKGLCIMELFKLNNVS